MVLLDKGTVRGIRCDIVDQDVEAAEAFEGEVDASSGGVVVGGVRRETDCAR